MLFKINMLKRFKYYLKYVNTLKIVLYKSILLLRISSLFTLRKCYTPSLLIVKLKFGSSC